MGPDQTSQSVSQSGLGWAGLVPPSKGAAAQQWPVESVSLVWLRPPSQPTQLDQWGLPGSSHLKFTCMFLGLEYSISQWTTPLSEPATHQQNL